MTVLLGLALAMVFGLIFTRIMKAIHLPNVTGFLIAGLLVGPYCLRILDGENLKSFSIISTVALGFIAFSIGSEFKISNIKKLGGKVVVITLTQSFGAAILVGLALFAIGAPIPIVFTMAAIATATAPAATLMVVRQYKAKGIVTDTLLPVVAFDDAVGLLVFSICFALAKTFSTGDIITAYSILLLPFLEIIFSLVCGGVIGLLLSVCMRSFKSRANRLSLMIVATILGVAICELVSNTTEFSMSSLLTCMMIGAVFCNIRSDSSMILEGCDRWTPPLFMLFFVISGAELQLDVIPTVGLIGIVYIVVRSLGKYFGVVLGAQITKADSKVKKYLGITLLPQAGVAIGMAQIASNGLGEYGVKIMAITLTATLVYEIIGPVLTKVALTKAGEIEKVEKPPKKLKTS